MATAAEAPAAPSAAETTTTTSTETAAPPAGKTNFGDAFRKALSEEKATDGDVKKTAQPPAPAKKADVAAATPEKNGDETQASDKKPAAEKKGAAKRSALDAALEAKTGDKPAEAAATPENTDKDVLSDFDEKNPDWAKARGVMKTQSEELKSLRPKIADLEARLAAQDPKIGETLQSTQKELDGLKKQYADALDVIKRINVEYSPEFRAKYVEGRQKEAERALDRVKKYGGNADAFAEALELPDGKARTEKLREALADVDEIDRPRILNVLEQIQKLDDEAAELKSNPNKAFEELEARRNEERTRQSEEAARLQKQEFDRISKSLRERSPFLKTVDPTTEGGKEWNDEVKTAYAEAEKLFSPDTPYETLVERAVKGVRYDSVEKLLIETRSELSDALSRLREYEEASPDLSTAGRRAPEAKTTVPRGQRYQEALNASRGNIEV